MSAPLLTLSPFLLFGAALSYVVGLAWNDAVQTGINKYFPNKNNSFGAKMIYAFAVTVIIIVVVFILNWMAARAELTLTKNF